jgi:hypothetical protein
MWAGVMLSGCNSATEGSPTAATTPPDTTDSTSGATPSSTPSEGLAPPVRNPKDLRDVDPCQLLTAAQQSQLGFTEPGEEGTSYWGEPECGWPGSVVAVGLSPNTTAGLDQAYRNKNNFDNFAPSEVDEYPAARINFATQSCGLIVGVADDQTLHMEFTRVSPDAPGSGDPCGFAESVMGDVIKNLPDA